MKPQEKYNPKRILFFKIGAIGDVLMTTPLVRQVRKEFPKAKLTYYVGKAAGSVLEGNKNINKIVKFDQNLFHKKKILQAVKLRNQITKEKFDLAFVFDKHKFFPMFIKACKIPLRIGFDRDGGGKYNTRSIKYEEIKHEVHYYFSLLEKLDIKPSNNTQLDMYLSKENMKFANNFFNDNKLTGKVICVTPGGGQNPGESYPVRRWAHVKSMELIKKLSDKYKILLVGGPEDVELHESMIKFLKKKNIVNAAGKTSLRESAALMKKCAVIVCNDSGPMHLAAAVNNKIVSIFGPTNPSRKAPLHEESISIWKDQDIYEEEYELRGKLPSINKKNKWMKKITVKEVLDAVKRLI